MPIPTDTFWSIKRLNWVFAISAVLLFAVTIWSIFQDHLKSWHTSQQQGRVWDAALTSERLEAETSNAQRETELKKVEKDLADANAALDKQRDRIDSLKAQIQKLTGEQSTREFALNNEKANLTVAEGALQDAIAADDKPRIERLTRDIEEPRKSVGTATESLKNEIIAPLEHAKQELRDETKQRDALEGQKRKLLTDRESLQKKLHTLDPNTQGGLWGFIGGVSSKVRNAPLLDFVNPSEKPQQAVLTDIKTDMNFELKIPTVDRCASCHVNINRKEFQAERIISFLEEQAAIARTYELPLVAPAAPTKASATKDKPGPVAMPDFWQAWALKVAPDAVKRNAGRINTIVGTVGKTTAITLDGQPLATFKYNPALNTGPTAPSTQPTTAPSIDGPTQNTILVTLLEALYRGAGESKSADGKVVVTIKATDPKTLEAPRDVAMRYVEELRKGVTATVDKDQARLIDDRYRYALTDVVNVMRKKKGFSPLDASPALLAHPHLEMYVDADSKHPMEGGENKVGVGCTSCHDGSGQETDFVLAAHVPREIMVDQRTGTPVPAALLPKEALPHEDERSNLGSMLAVVAPEDEIVPKNVDALHVHLDGAHEAADAKHETHEGGGEKHGVAETGKTAEPAPAHHAHGETPKPVNYIDPVTGKQSKAVTQMTYWKARFEPEAPRDFALVYHEWDWPMRTPKYLQANCARCHSSILDIKDEAPTLYNGRQLFAELGCVNCHQMDSIPTEDLPTNAKHLDPALVMSNGRVKVGPSLTNITAKLSPQFINTWIWAPKAFRPTTKMPHFFMLENNSSDEEIRRTRQEARAITEYLVQASDPLPVAHPIQPSMKGSPEAGKSVFNAIGCQACHANVNDPTGEKRAGANGKPITLGEKWIVTDLTKAGELKKQLAAQSGKDPDDKALRAEAEKLFDAMSYNERQAYIKERFEEEPGQTEIARYADNSPKPIFVHVGPELSAVGTKLTAGRTPEQARAWLFDWLKEPRHYSAYTIMPRLRLNDQQAIDVVEYLLAQTRKKENPDDKWEPGLADVDPDKQVELAALFLRSQFSAKTAIERAKDDKFITDLAVDAMKRSAGKTPEEDKVLLDEARKRVETMPIDQKRMVWLGKKLIANYGCMSCHAINGTEKITSPCANLTNWGVKTVDKLDYGYVDPHKLDALPPEKPIMLVNGLSAEASKLAHDKINFNETKIAQPVNASWPVIEHLRQAWLTQKLKNTRVYDRGRALLEPDASKTDDVMLKSGKPYDKLKMPTFYLNDEQVDQLVTFVISNRDEKGRPWLVSDKLAQKANTDVTRQIARGRELTTKFNCVSCHWIESNQPQVQQYFRSEDIGTRAPPALRGEGNKVQFSWLFNFFKNVQDLRPLLYQHNGIRMPSFPATDDEWSAIITYFNHVSNKEAKDLKERLDLVNKYVDAEKAKTGALPPPEKPWPGDDWYRKPEFEVTAAKLTKWALETRNMQPIELDPSKSTPDDLGKKYRQAVYKARFTIDLYTSPFPFVENGQREVSDERFKLGGEFMQQMQCLSCHYLGDPNAPGAVKEPKAPNLSLTAQRLQRRWVRHWVQEPPVIQPGTSMPAFISGLAVFKLQGQTWSETAGRPKNEIDFYNARYGKTADEQADLVLDYLYAAGQRGITEVNVPGNTLPHPEAPAEPPKTTPGPAGATSQPASGGDVPAKSPPTTTPSGAPTTKPVGLRSPCKSVLFEDTFRRALGTLEDEESSRAA